MTRRGLATLVSTLASLFIVSILSVIYAPAASADASSPWKPIDRFVRPDSTALLGCGKSIIGEDGPPPGHLFNRGLASSNAYEAASCNARVAAPAGYLGLNVTGIRNGIVCASTGFTSSPNRTARFAKKARLCTNPSGTQNYRTMTWAAVYHTNTSDYTGKDVLSPIFSQ